MVSSSTSTHRRRRARTRKPRTQTSVLLRATAPVLDPTTMGPKANRPTARVNSMVAYLGSTRRCVPEPRLSYVGWTLGSRAPDPFGIASLES